MKDGLVGSIGLDLNPHNHFAFGGEFKRVSDQIHDDLPQPGWVSDQSVRQLGWNVAQEFQALLLGADTQGTGDVFQRVAQTEIDAFEVQPAPSWNGVFPTSSRPTKFDDVKLLDVALQNERDAWNYRDN